MVTIGQTRNMKVPLATATKLEAIAERRGIQGRGRWAHIAREILDKAVAEGAT